MANFGAQGPGAGNCVTKVAISVSCDNLLDMDVFSKSDPMCVLSMDMSSRGPHWCEVRLPKNRKLLNLFVIYTCVIVEYSTVLGLEIGPDFALSYLTDWPDREDHELPQPQVFQDVCHRLLL